jgi:hypothetical protein
MSHSPEQQRVERAKTMRRPSGEKRGALSP